MKVINRYGVFNDKLENRRRNVNDIFKVTEERYHEINEKLKAAQKEGDPSWVIALDELKVSELKELADLKDIEYPSNVRKADLIDLL